MATPFAAAEARLGRALGARLANATARFNGSESVSGIFTSAAAISSVGQAGMFARQVTFACPAENIAGMLVDNGVAIEIDHPAATANHYVVKQRQPDETHTGWVSFVVEPRQ